MRKYVAALVGVVALAGAVPAAASAVAPVNYSDTASGAGGATRSHTACFDESGASWVDDFAPTNVWRYRGTATVYWYSQLKWWNGRQWVTSGTRVAQLFQIDSVYTLTGWIFNPTQRDWINKKTGGSAPAEWHVNPGHYYAADNVTTWLNSSGQTIHRWLNTSTFCHAR